MARQGWAGHGSRQGKARHGSARSGGAWLGVARQGIGAGRHRSAPIILQGPRQGVARQGMAWRGKAWDRGGSRDLPRSFSLTPGRTAGNSLGAAGAGARLGGARRAGARQGRGSPPGQSGRGSDRRDGRDPENHRQTDGSRRPGQLRHLHCRTEPGRPAWRTPLAPLRLPMGGDDRQPGAPGFAAGYRAAAPPKALARAVLNPCGRNITPESESDGQGGVAT